MRRTTYSAEYKSKIVIEVLQGERTLDEIAASNSLNPNMVRNWKKEFIENASKVFDNSSERELERRKEEQQKEKTRMLKTIGQLTLERVFLHDCFRASGLPIPQADNGTKE